ncbi:MAG: hypothetical protein WBA76_15190 [Phormidesmis sp.]
MSSKSIEIKDIEEIAEQAHSGVDVSEHFSGRFQKKQVVELALPLDLLQNIDAECQQSQMSRQDWIKMACAEKVGNIRQAKAHEAA